MADSTVPDVPYLVAGPNIGERTWHIPGTNDKPICGAQVVGVPERRYSQNNIQPGDGTCKRCLQIHELAPEAQARALSLINRLLSSAGPLLAVNSEPEKGGGVHISMRFEHGTWGFVMPTQE